MKKGKIGLHSVIGALVGIACALALGAAFYGVMAYQLADGPQKSAETALPDALLAIADVELAAEQTAQQDVGGETCTVTTRTYHAADGLEIETVSASPAAYAERLSEEKWTAQLVTGFTLAGLDAVYSVRGEEGLLSARAGDRIYMLRAPVDEQALYVLGAGAYLE